VPERFDSLLPRTLGSLRKAGFDAGMLRLFVDWDIDPVQVRGKFPDCSVTVRSPRVRTLANWVLGLAELWFRDPHADLYVMFQDDFVTCRNVRAYLEASMLPTGGYMNLFTFMDNETRISGRTGWVESSQLGRGAVALIFPKDSVAELLTHKHMIVRKPQSDNERSWKLIDGGISEVFRNIRQREHVHAPSLVQHIGTESSMGNRQHPQAASFPGEDFDCMTLLDRVPRVGGGFGWAVGRWHLYNGTRPSSHLQVNPDGTALRKHAPDHPGRLERDGDGGKDRFRIRWEDGHRDVLEFSGGEVRFFGLGQVGEAWESPPRITLRAVRTSG
jgi:hypothetical protein